MKINNKIYFKDFYAYFFAASLIVVLFSAYTLSSICLNLKAEKKELLNLAGNQITSKVEDEFSQLKDFLFFLGKQIATSKDMDFKKVQSSIEVLCDKTGHTSPLKGIILDWISSNKKLIYKHADNVQDNLIDMSFRPYVKESQQSPWTLHLDPPAIGVPDGLWEVPGGMGIVNEEGNFLGIIAIGVNIAEFNSRLQQMLANRQVSFIVLDKDFNIVFQSFDNGIDPKSSFYRQAFKTNKAFLGKEGNLTTPVLFNNIKYNFFKKIEGYPYIILLGYNKDLFYHEYIMEAVPALFNIILLTAILTIFFYLLQKKKINLLNSSYFAQELFRKKIIASAKQLISDYLEKINYEKETTLNKIKNMEERRIFEDFFANTVNLTPDIFLLSPQNGQFSPIDVNKIITECVLLNTQKAATKMVKINTKLEPLPELNANDLCFRQLIIGLISMSLEYTPEGGQINIVTQIEENNGKKALNITFSDNGPSLCRDDIIRIQNRFFTDNDEVWNGISSNFLFIEKLVHMHFGECHFTCPRDNGKSIRIVFPYEQIKKSTLYYEDLASNRSEIVFH